jgi:hypothetical protein
MKERSLAKIKISLSLGRMFNIEKLDWGCVISYGPGKKMEIPLPVRILVNDWVRNEAEALEAMESLARALLDFVDHRRRTLPPA